MAGLAPTWQDVVGYEEKTPARMKRHNQSGLLLADRMCRHPAVERVWYPKWEFSEAYDAARRPAGGWGSLITFLPRHADQASPRIYDRLALCKGLAPAQACTSLRASSASAVVR